MYGAPGNGSLVLSAEDPQASVKAHASMLDVLGHAVIATDMTGIITYWNAAAESLYGFQANEVVGQQIYYVLPAALGDHEIDSMMDGFAAGKPWDGILHVRAKDGRWLRTVHSDRPLMDAAGTALGVVSVSFPIDRTQDVLSAERKQFVTKDLVRALLKSLRRDGHESASRMRETGNALAREGNCPGITVYLELFSTMGLGDIKIDKEEGTRYVFSGSDLIERRASSAVPTCHLPLGFLEGAVATLSQKRALGAEIACQSMGAPRCVFVVSAR